MYGVARGTGFLAADGTTVPVNNPWLFEMGNARLLGVPLPVVITIVVVLALHYVLSQTRFGQYTYAIGGNRMAALRSGINVRRHTMMIYLISAGCAGIAGMIYTARFSAGAAQAGEPLLLDSIAAVVIGGASLFGGSGTIIGTVIGALIIAVIQYGLVFIDVEPFWQFVAVGVVIIVSVLVDQSRAGSRARSRMRAEPMADGPLLEARDLSKRFGGVQALQQVSFRLHAGEVLALAGDNGAGKSTLIKCISGVHHPDEGEILYRGRPVRLDNPREARERGIETIYQDLALADNLDVGANVFLGREPATRRFGVLPAIDRRRMRAAAREVLKTLEIEIRPPSSRSRCARSPAASARRSRSAARSTGKRRS